MPKSTFTERERSPIAHRDRRERLGISVDDLAAQAGISASDLIAYEQAKTDADVNLIVGEKVAIALDELEAEQNEGEA